MAEQLYEIDKKFNPANDSVFSKLLHVELYIL